MNRKVINKSIVIVAGTILLLWLFCLPKSLFRNVVYSTVVTDKNGELLGARVADDGQWRFPMIDTVPEKFAKALIEFEDHRFYSHCGVSFRSLFRATLQNIRNGRVVSGGSTITMQLLRISRQKPRTIWQKVIEVFMATRLETRYGKDEILRMYASHAPFGGNVVGLKAAMWRYFGNGNVELSWAEAATLAVLQNAPSLINLDKNRDALEAKRNRLLARLHDKGVISDDDYELSLDEPLIGEPYPMPQYAPHLVEHYHKTAHGKQTVTGINLPLQIRVEELAVQKSKELRQKNIRDLAIVIKDIESGEIVAYCGNTDMTFNREGKWVDIARSPRSSGSILKPLLYDVALKDGVILPKTLLPDIPTDFGGFVPKNFDGTYSGAIPADKAISLSLNIPSVHLLKEYGISAFARKLQSAGFESLSRPAHEYGLSLVLGGAEVRLIDVVNCYALMAAYYIDTTHFSNHPFNEKVSLYYTLNTMREVNRPDQMDWRRAVSVQNVAWKTGTSYGGRDAWAVGVTPKYAVGVWAGNADGSGVADLTGASCAGPVLFDLFGMLPYSPWFEEPDSADGSVMKICKHSGYRAGRFCDDTEEILLPKNSIKTQVCPHCKEILVSLDGSRRVNDRSEPTRVEHFFTLEPQMEHYYKQQHPEFVSLPPLSALETDVKETFQFVYPSDGSVISLTRQIDGSQGGVICKVAHSAQNAELFWHLDNSYIGSTTHLHNIQIYPKEGYHTLTVVDNVGNRQSIYFIIK